MTHEITTETVFEPEPPPDALSSWLSERLPGRGPFLMERISGGNSNVTYKLTDSGGPILLRRPPEAKVDAGAHSMARENRIISALGPTDAPSPSPIAYCEDTSVIGGEFILMEFVEGHALRDALPEGAPPQPEAARQAGFAAIEGLAKLHGVDWRAAGLEGYGRHEGFLDRQVPRWTKQYRSYATRDLPLFDEVARRLEAGKPAGFEPAVMHGDFHLDNTLVRFGAEGEAEVAAIIDWEMSTIGPPLLDLGLFLAFWGFERPQPPERPAMPRVQAVSRVPGAPTREALADRYSELTGTDVIEIRWYQALAFWKLAAIVEGAYANYLNGTDKSRYARELGEDVPCLLDEAARFAGVND